MFTRDNMLDRLHGMGVSVRAHRRPCRGAASNLPWVHKPDVSFACCVVRKPDGSMCRAQRSSRMRFPLLTLSGAGQADAARVLQPTPGASVLLRVCRNMVNVYSEVYTQPADKKYLLQVRLPMHYHASMRRTQGGACSLTPSHPSHPLGHHHRC